MLNGAQNIWMRVRLILVAVLLLCGATVIVVRMVTLQVTQSAWLEGLAREQYLREIALEPMRGQIVDRRGAPIAVSVMTDSIFAIPQEITNPHNTARALARTLGLVEKRLVSKLTSDRQFVWIKRRVTPAEAEAVRALQLKGVRFTQESRRFYPARELAGALVGFAGDGRGLEGLELLFDGRLRGATVLAHGLRDARGRLLYADAVSPQDAGRGAGLGLTIDLTIQEIVETELERAVQDAGAKAGTAIVMDPHSGEILAMASYPGFNPNAFSKAPPANRRNRAVTDCFEPGSTLKVFAMAEALQMGLVKPSEQIDCQWGTMQIGGHTIHDSSGHRFGLLTPKEVLVHSSNIGMAKIGLRLGRERLYHALHRAGFGRITGAEVPGEARCQLAQPTNWSEIGLANIAFGQGVSVTSLQLVSAYAALANGGIWMKPLLVKEIRGLHDEVIQRFDPEPQGRVFAPATVAQVTDMLTGVSETGGTGTLAAVPGFRVAGKTGTAQKQDPITGGYSRDKRIASFIGFVPAEQPRITVLVTVDEPTTSPYGGVVAAPAFARISGAALAYLGVFSNRAPTMASVAAVAPEQADEDEQEELSGATRAATTTVSASSPEAPASLIPDVRGMSLREALRRLAGAGVEVSVQGSGRVRSQKHVPGTGSTTGPTRVSLLLEHDAPGTNLKPPPLVQPSGDR
jgi:cell division protein FtsI (penicillin-binding protein 3)